MAIPRAANFPVVPARPAQPNKQLSQWLRQVTAFFEMRRRRYAFLAALAETKEAL